MNVLMAAAYNAYHCWQASMVRGAYTRAGSIAARGASVYVSSVNYANPWCTTVGFVSSRYSWIDSHCLSHRSGIGSG